MFNICCVNTTDIFILLKYYCLDSPANSEDNVRLVRIYSRKPGQVSVIWTSFEYFWQSPVCPLPWPSQLICEVNTACLFLLILLCLSVSSKVTLKLKENDDKINNNNSIPWWSLSATYLLIINKSHLPFLPSSDWLWKRRRSNSRL